MMFPKLRSDRCWQGCVLTFRLATNAPLNRRNNFLTEIISFFFEQYQNNEIAYLPKHCFLTYRPVFVESAKQTIMLWDK